MGDLDWRMLRKHPATDHRVFRVQSHDAAHPVTGQTHTFTVIESPDWVNVIALTPADLIVMVRQFRHGTQRQTLEIPGGMVDPGETAEAAARRELREETGYVAQRWSRLGVVEPNPAIQSNRCHTWLALDARPDPDAPDALDPGEVIDVELHPLADMPARVRNGDITHALVIAGFYHLVTAAGGWRRPAEFSNA